MKNNDQVLFNTKSLIHNASRFIYEDSTYLLIKDGITDMILNIGQNDEIDSITITFYAGTEEIITENEICRRN
jgi:hypothetical protein